MIWRNMIFIFSATLFVSFLTPIFCFAQAQDSSAAANWPNWRGPNSDGVAIAATPPIKWSETENVKWKIEVPGRGISTPVIWGDKIIVSTAISKGGDDKQAGAQPPPRGEGPPPGKGPPGRGGRGGASRPTSPYEFAVVCFDRETGKQNWMSVVNEAIPHEGAHNTNTYASASPITDGQHIFVSFGSNGIYCLDMDGKVLWSKMLGKMQTRNSFGEGASPALFEDMLVVPWDHEGQSFIVALDAKTGEQKWKVDRDEPTTWATPLIVEFNGTHQVVTNGTKRVRSYDLKDGSLIWECGGQVTNPIPSPIRDGNFVLVMTGYQGFAIQSIALDSKGDVTDSKQAVRWQRNDAAPYVASGVLYKGNLYFTKGRDPILSIVKASDGSVLVDQKRLSQMDGLYASLTAANDHIYAVGRNGVTTVLKQGDTFDVVSTNKLDEGLDASPVAIGKQLFLRGEKHLYCFEEK